MIHAFFLKQSENGGKGGRRRALPLPHATCSFGGERVAAMEDVGRRCGVRVLLAAWAVGRDCGTMHTGFVNMITIPSSEHRCE